MEIYTDEEYANMVCVYEQANGTTPEVDILCNLTFKYKHNPAY